MCAKTKKLGTKQNNNRHKNLPIKLTHDFAKLCKTWRKNVNKFRVMKKKAD
jgi:hypothetical protein